MIDKEIQEQLIKAGRSFTKGYMNSDPYMEDFLSDQDQKLPQPPLVKACPVDGQAQIDLPKDFSNIIKKSNLLDVIRDRKSNRIYTNESITLEQLSFLLWATQGVKSIRGKRYATLRTVPCGGARHEFETYLLVRNVRGLAPGAYQYLPLEHKLAYLHSVENIEKVIADSLSGQTWAAKAAVVFYWSMVPYRAEWRYGIYAHRIALIDVGHVGQNLYTACTGLGLGCCAIGAFSHELCSSIFNLDGEEEYIVYTMPVGNIRQQDLGEESAFYKFVEDEGL